MLHRLPLRWVVLTWLAVALWLIIIGRQYETPRIIPFFVGDQNLQFKTALDRLPHDVSSWNPAQHSVIIGTRFETHEDVWLYLAGTLKAMGVETTIYGECDDANSTCVKFGQLEFAQELGLWNERR